MKISPLCPFQVLDGLRGTWGCSCVSVALASTATWECTSPGSNLSTWTSGHPSRSRYTRREWAKQTHLQHNKTHISMTKKQKNLSSLTFPIRTGLWCLSHWFLTQVLTACLAQTAMLSHTIPLDWYDCRHSLRLKLERSISCAAPTVWEKKKGNKEWKTCF